MNFPHILPVSAHFPRFAKIIVSPYFYKYLAVFEKFMCFYMLYVHSGYFYSAPLSPLQLRGAPDYSTDTAPEFHAETHRQL